MRAAVVPPPIFSRLSRREAGVGVYPPLGALCIATVAIEKGHDVRLCDLAIARRRGRLPSRSRWYEAAADHILGLEPEVVGFGTVCSSFPTSVLVCRELKRRRPAVTTVFGGPHASMVYGELLRVVPEVDFVLTGEADLSFTDLLGRLETHSGASVQGLAERRGGEVVHEPRRDAVDLDDLPVPDFGLWPFEEAVEKGWWTPLVPLDAGRGCPHACTFCSTSRFFGRRFRMKSPARIAGEMQHLYRRHGFAWFTLTSDTFTADRRVVLDVCDAIANTGIPALSWACSARIDTVDRELLETMRDSGCHGVFFGVESGSPRIQRRIGKNLDLRRLGTVMGDCLALGLSVEFSTIVGFPEEEWRDVSATLDVLLRFAGIDTVEPIPYILSPQPGTPITDRHAGPVSFDGWSSNLCRFDGGIPPKELGFVKRHLTLCPEFGFFPNERVDRRELTRVLEFASLLLDGPPGFTAFARRVSDDPLALLRSWRSAADREGLAAPTGSDFFRTMSSARRSRYLLVLLDLLQAEHSETDRERDFVAYFRGLLDCTVARRGESLPVNGTPRRLTVARRRSVPMDARPVLARVCAFANLRHDVLETIRRWRETGRWRWPREKAVSYLFVGKRRHVSVARAARAANLVARRCDGEHSIRDLLALVDCLEDPETKALKASMGARRLTASILASLCRSPGLGLV